MGGSYFLFWFALYALPFFVSFGGCGLFGALAFQPKTLFTCSLRGFVFVCGWRLGFALSTSARCQLSLFLFLVHVFMWFSFQTNLPAKSLFCFSFFSWFPLQRSIYAFHFYNIVFGSKLFWSCFLFCFFETPLFGPNWGVQQAVFLSNACVQNVQRFVFSGCPCSSFSQVPSENTTNIVSSDFLGKHNNWMLVSGPIWWLGSGPRLVQNYLVKIGPQTSFDNSIF